MRHARGIEREQVLDHLATEFDVRSERGRQTLRRRYHALESGSLLGSNLSHRLLKAIATVFKVDARDLIDAAASTRPLARASIASAMGRGSSTHADARDHAGEGDRQLPPDADAQLVDRLFCGGPDA